MDGQPVEEEWKEFEQEQRKDYSGLKIGQLTINDRQQQPQQQQHQSDDIYDDEDEDSDGYANSDPNVKRSGGGPWKKLIPAEEVTQIPVPVEPEQKSTKYIAPAYRHSVSIIVLCRLRSCVKFLIGLCSLSIFFSSWAAAALAVAAAAVVAAAVCVRVALHLILPIRSSSPR